jgi:hypothetical protein
MFSVIQGFAFFVLGVVATVVFGVRWFQNPQHAREFLKGAYESVRPAKIPAVISGVCPLCGWNKTHQIPGHAPEEQGKTS